MDFQCNVCHRNFNRKSNLKRHMKSCCQEKLANREYICDVCQHSSTTKADFLKHWRSHTTQPSNLKPTCPICKIAFDSSVIISHFEQHVGTKIKEKQLTFPDEKFVFDWKKKFEKETFSKFLLQRTWKKKSGAGRKYVCHRSGFFISKSKGQQYLKCTGSKQINGFCPASIVVTSRKDEIAGFCVKVIDCHIGHGNSGENDLCHLNISPTKKEEIARKLIDKVPKFSILESIRKSCNGNITREHLMTRQDIDNVGLKFNITTEFKKDSNDAVSVDITIKKLLEKDDSMIKYYKPQDTIDKLVPFLEEKDFVLIIMDPTQKEMLEKFGGKIICIDATHGIGYNFLLFSIVILDEYHQGFPTSFMISNRKDTLILKFFFETIKSCVGVVHPKVFMSDMASELYTAWSMVMGTVDQHLYCSWHVTKAWRENLPKIKEPKGDDDDDSIPSVNAKAKTSAGRKSNTNTTSELPNTTSDESQNTTSKSLNTPNKQNSTFSKLTNLMRELDQNKFEILLSDLKQDFQNDKDLKVFGNYFANNYEPIIKQWAYFFRKNATINTNMCVERMHRTLKYGFFNGKKITRLDKTIHCLRQFTESKVFDRLVVLHKKKLSYKLKELRKRHAKFNQVEVTCNGNPSNANTFLITSKNEVYYIEENPEPCNDDCKLICTRCDNVCIHKYLCSCHDNTVKFNFCKHIHAVCQFLKNNQSSPTLQIPLDSSPSVLVMDSPIVVNSAVANNEALHENEINNIKTRINKRRKTTIKFKDLKKVFIDISRLTRNKSNDRRLFLKQLLIMKKKFEIMGNKPKCSLPVTKRSTNSNIVKQRRLFSTVKKNKKKDLPTRMTYVEKENCFLTAIG